MRLRIQVGNILQLARRDTGRISLETKILRNKKARIVELRVLCASALAKSREALLGSSAVRLKTYIVEDNPTIRENLIATLEELANVDAVGTADTENEGKAWLASHSEEWNLAIVDLFLKQGSGLGVVSACRERNARQKVVVLSNYATSDIRQRCAQLGVDAVFDKSNEIDDLVDYCIKLCNPDD